MRPILLALQEGPLPAADFMALALYHPDGGYYRRSAPPWGFRGKDYYTALDLGPLLGAAVAARLRRAWMEMDRPQAFTVLEPGAGRGWLGRDILSAADGDFALALRYIHCDDSPAARREAEEALAPMLGDGRAAFAAESDQPPHFTGAVISNELLDALPAQPMRWDGEKWEIEALLPPEPPGARPRPAWVPYDGSDRKCHRSDLRSEAPDPVPGEGPTQWFARQAEGGLQPGDASVWAPALPALLERVCRPLQRGVFLTIDYGDSAARLLAKGAGLRRYRGHTVDGDWWDSPGESDLTADVDFTRLAHLLEGLGLRPAPRSTLGGWVCAAAPLKDWEAEWQSLPPEDRAARAKNLMQLTLPDAMGERFKVLEATIGL